MKPVQKIARPAAIAALLLGLSACAANKASCDPSQVGNVFQAGLCAGSGTFSERQADIQLEIDRVDREIVVTDAETAEIRSRARKLSKDRKQLEAESRRLKNNIASARAQLNQLSASGKLQKVQVAASMKTLDDAQKDAEFLEEKAAVEAEISTTLQAIEKKRKRLKLLTTVVVI